MNTVESPFPAFFAELPCERPPIQAAHACSSDPGLAAEELYRTFANSDLALLLFFCSSRYDLPLLEEALRARFSGIPVVGCTTAGEIGPAGYRSDSLVGVGLTSAHFEAQAYWIDDLVRFDEDQARAAADDMRRGLGPLANRSFSVLLIDGLSGREERVARHCQRALGEICLVGGSAGDDQVFKATRVFHGGRFRRGAVWVTVGSRLPFNVFRSSHFVGASEPLVVTEADANRRIVREINGHPAALEYARVLNHDVRSLDSSRCAAAPLVVKVGGNDYVRSIQSINADDSLTLYCAIDTGVVLRVAKSVSLVEERRRLFEDLRRSMGSPLLTLGFDCIHCQLEARNLGDLRSIEELFRENRVIGFSGYGEQFLGLHVNQTFSGVVICDTRP